jgi:SAM-dependent methyltransferase
MAVTDDFYRTIGAQFFAPRKPVEHRSEEYHEDGFEALIEMQERHFWYQGRHRFLLRAVKSQLRGRAAKASAIDLGGGCGGWVKYLESRAPGLFHELALADSSLCALDKARSAAKVLNPCYQLDLLDMGWRERWDVAFLLDVLEHIPDDGKALEEIHTALCPGGLLFVTTPAFMFFWSYNDEIGGHQRRYRRGDFQRLADGAGFELLSARYFMFFLSPLLFLSRLHGPDLERMSHDEIRRFCLKSHRPPAAPLNWILARVFDAETPLGHWLPFPWGTSILGVFRKR